MIVNELFPMYVRDLGVAFINLLQWTFNLGISLTFLLMKKYVGLAITYWIFSAIGVISFILLFIMLPETKSKKIGQVRDEDT